MPPRKTRLQRVPLQRTTELPRGGDLSRGNGMERRQAEKRRTLRDAGFPPVVRRLIKKRDKWCAGCGINVAGIPFSIQHRAARGMGGTSRPEASTAVNGCLLCGSATTPGSCHQKAESRDPEMHRRGLWLWSWQNPAEVPVGYATPEGLAWFLLEADGGRTPVDEPEASAA
jgi:hypothetical protein